MGRLDLPEPTREQRYPFGITHRELSVLLTIAEGRSTRETGRELSISESTVKVHVRHLLHKLKARNRAHAVAIYYRWLRENDREAWAEVVEQSRAFARERKQSQPEGKYAGYLAA